jgi:hypothetical protein
MSLNLAWIYWGSKHLGKLDNSPKFELNIIFMNVNLDYLTCMQEFEVTTQVAIDLIWIIFKLDLNLNSYSSKVYILGTL